MCSHYRGNRQPVSGGLRAVGEPRRSCATDKDGPLRGRLRTGYRLQPIALTLVLVVALSLTACQRERREYRGTPLAETTPTVAMTQLFPGAANPPGPDPRREQYEGNAYHISEGKRLFDWFNCSGCHAHGGGGSGPALMDDSWIYGGEIEQIVATISQGRPNGMPSFRGKIPEQQMWELAAYIRSMSGNVPKSAAGSRDEHMRSTPPQTRIPTEPPKPSSLPSSSTGTTP